MDKLEYIPGDLVKFATNTYTIVNFEENFLHNKICYALLSTNSTKTAFVADRDILPIPHTPEIIEKNGWKKHDGFDSYWLGKMGLLQDGDVWHHCLGSIKIAVTLGNIQYVHQLQHFLFGLRLNYEMEV